MKWIFFLLLVGFPSHFILVAFHLLHLPCLFPAEASAISVFFCRCFPVHSTRKNVDLSGHEVRIGGSFRVGVQRREGGQRIGDNGRLRTRQMKRKKENRLEVQFAKRRLLPEACHAEGSKLMMMNSSPLLARIPAMRTSIPSAQEMWPAHSRSARVEQARAREPFAIALGGRGKGRACMHTDKRKLSQREGLPSIDDSIKRG